MKLFEKAEKNKNSLALTDLNHCRTWNELEHRVCLWSLFLQRKAKLVPGDHIALHIGNRVEFIEVLLAGIVSGLWVTPVNTHLAKGEAAYILENCDARLLLHDSDNRLLVNSDLAVPSVCVNEPPFAVTETDVTETDVAETLQASEFITEDAPAGGTMLYTSGTTGKPKGVMRAKPAKLGDALARMKKGALAFGLKGEGAHLVTGPLYHAAPMLFALYDLLNGAPVVIMPKWDEALFWHCLNKYKITTTHLVPTMMVRLLKQRNQAPRPAEESAQEKPHHLSLVLHGAAPVARHTKEAMLDWWGDILVEYWGGSEAGVTTLVNSAEWRKKPGTVGKPLPHFSVFVGDAKGNPVDMSIAGSATEGELYCRHRDLPQVFSYHKDPEKTARAHPQPHVFSIGDNGYLDEDGFVYLSGRRSDLILSGGVNIYPAEIEQALIAHEAIADCAVTGVPDDEWGEQVVAVLQLTSVPACDSGQQEMASHQLEARLKQFLGERLARFKIPRRFVVVDTIPRMPTGKVKQSALKQLLV